MTNSKYMRYTKDNGDESLREVIVVAKPRSNYLVYDVTELSSDDIETLSSVLDDIDEYRESQINSFELITGIKQSNLWRSFKPEGIDWEPK